MWKRIKLNSYLNPFSISNVTIRNAGHSKWANIKHIKGQKDTERACLFTRLSRQMKVAVQEGGSVDPAKNLKLDQIIQQAKRLNMPVASIQSVIKSTQTDKSQCKSYMLEFKGPGSSIILCEVYTENLQQVKMNLATILKKHSSKFGDGGAKHLFEQKGIIHAQHPDATLKNESLLEQATDHAIEAGAEEVQLMENLVEFTCEPNAFQKVQTNLEKAGYTIKSASVEFTPTKLQTLSDTDLEVASSLYDKLDKLPEVVKIYDNIA